MVVCRVGNAVIDAHRSDNKGTRTVHIRKTDLEKIGYTAGCPACKVHRAGLPMSGQGHTAECGKRLEDVMMTVASTATCIEATRVRQTERFIRELADSGTTNPSSSSGSGHHKRVRFSDQDLEPKLDTEMQTGSQETPVTRNRSAETDAERLEEETAETAEADADKRIALKRKAENDPSDSEVEDPAMNSLVELWHREDDPDSEVDLLILQQRDRYVASVHETGGDKPVCEQPKTHFPYDECGWDYIDDTRLVVQEYKRQADWSLFTATPPLEALQVC